MPPQNAPQRQDVFLGRDSYCEVDMATSSEGMNLRDLAGAKDAYESGESASHSLQPIHITIHLLHSVTFF